MDWSEWLNISMAAITVSSVVWGVHCNNVSERRHTSNEGYKESILDLRKEILFYLIGPIRNEIRKSVNDMIEKTGSLDGWELVVDDKGNKRAIDSNYKKYLDGRSEDEIKTTQ